MIKRVIELNCINRVYNRKEFVFPQEASKVEVCKELTERLEGDPE